MVCGSMYFLGVPPAAPVDGVRGDEDPRRQTAGLNEVRAVALNGQVDVEGFLCHLNDPSLLVVVAFADVASRRRELLRSGNEHIDPP
jgi:hypothetical protein